MGGAYYGEHRKKAESREEVEFSWFDYKAMSLGLLPYQEWLEVEPIEVAIKYVHERNRKLEQENRDRRNVFFQWQGLGVKVGGMPLRYLWQVWNIPEIDGDWHTKVHYTKVRKLSKYEQRLLKEKPKGWEKKLLDYGNKRRKGN